MHVVEVDPLIGGAALASVMNLAVLWVCGRILHRRAGWWKMTAAALLGGVYQFWLAVRWDLGLVFAWEWGLFLLVGVTMVVVAYPSRHISQVIRGIFLFYMLTFLTVGLSMGVTSMIHLAGGRPLQKWQFIVVNIGVLLLLAELGWGMVHEAIWTRTHAAEIIIQMGEWRISLTALMDTGNMLRDPLTHSPVVVTSLPSVAKWLPSGLEDLIRKALNGELPEHFADEWRTRIRLLPFHSLGAKHGFLVGISVDSIQLAAPVRKILQPAVVGFTEQPISSGDYQAIFPAALIGEMSPIHLEEAKR